MKDKSPNFSIIFVILIILVVHIFFTLWFQPSLINQVYAFGLDIIGLIAWFIIVRLIKPPKSKLEIKLAGTGVTPEMLEEAVNEGMQKYNVLGSYLNKVKDSTIRKKIEDICSLVKDIIDDLQKDPKDLKAAKKFLSYYLDATIKIIRQYTDLSAQTEVSEEVKKTLIRVENLLDTIKRAFEKQLAKLLEDDVIDLDTEISVLEKTIKMEGLHND